MRFLFVALVIVLLLPACARIPESVGFEYSKQQKLQAAHHWNVFAVDIANEINNELIQNDYLDTPVFVRETCGDENRTCDPLQTTTFNETFRDLLITHLVKLGVPTISTNSKEAIIINYKAQPVYHHAKRWRTLKPGMLTALTAGVMVIKNAPAEFIAIATAGAIDGLNAGYSSTSNFEVIITTSMITKENYLYRNSNIYYINDADSWHYQTHSNATEIELTNDHLTLPERQSAVNSPISEHPEQRFDFPYANETTGI